MIDRFKRYLEREFRVIAPTKRAMEYREEVLADLLDRAQEYRIKGITDDDIIYDMCIDSLGDFRATLKDFESKAQVVKKRTSKIGVIGAVAASVALLFVIVYLVTSFATGAWAKTWLILVGGAFACVICGAVFGIIKCVKKNKKLPVHVFLAAIITLSFVFLFLVLQILVGWQNSWISFLVMVIALSFADALYSWISASKLKVPMTMAAVTLLFTMLYVILGVTYTVPWHPYWLLPVVGAFVSIAFLATYVTLYLKKKKNKIENNVKTALGIENEEYYTKWKE